MKEKYKEYFKLNRNVFIGFLASITISALVAQSIADQEDYLNTTVTLIADYAVFFSVLGFLLYLDNRKKYKLDSGETDWTQLKTDLIKMITSLGIAEIIYTIFRWISQFYLLSEDYDPYMASIIGQIISLVIYMAALNLIIKLTGLYKDES